VIRRGEIKEGYQVRDILARESLKDTPAREEPSKETSGKECTSLGEL